MVINFVQLPRSKGYPTALNSLGMTNILTTVTISCDKVYEGEVDRAGNALEMMRNLIALGSGKRSLRRVHNTRFVRSKGSFMES